MYINGVNDDGLYIDDILVGKMANDNYSDLSYWKIEAHFYPIIGEFEALDLLSEMPVHSLIKIDSDPAIKCLMMHYGFDRRHIIGDADLIDYVREKYTSVKDFTCIDRPAWRMAKERGLLKVIFPDYRERRYKKTEIN